MFSSKFRICQSYTAILILLMASSISGNDSLTYETVALSDSPAAGAGAGVVMDGFFAGPVINENGQVAFIAELAGAGVNENNRRALYVWSNGLYELVAREDDLAAGFIGDIRISQVHATHLLDNAGKATFTASLNGPGVNGNFAMFSNGFGSTDLVTVFGGAVPEAGALVDIDTFHAPVLGGSGEVAFYARLTGAGVDSANDRAVFSYSGVQTDMLVREGDPAPGAAPGVNFSLINSVQINDNGQVAISPSLTSGGSGVFTVTNGVVQPMVLSGAAAPGTPAGVIFDSVRLAGINNNGQITIRAGLLDSGGGQTTGIFSNGSGSLELLAQSGQDAPGIPFGGNYDGFFSILLNGAGDTMFVASLNGLGVNETNDSAIFVENGGELELVARTGNTPPDTGPGVKFLDFQHPSFNSVGQIVFRAELTGTGVDHSNEMALYIHSNGQLQQVVREGDLFDVNDDPMFDDLRTVAFIETTVNGSATQDGSRAYTNDAGQIAMRLRFTDGSSGIFIASGGFLLGDVNGDGSVDLLDVAPFVDAVVTGAFVPAADINGDGVVDLLDVAPFVDLLTGV